MVRWPFLGPGAEGLREEEEEEEGGRLLGVPWAIIEVGLDCDGVGWG